MTWEQLVAFNIARLVVIASPGLVSRGVRAHTLLVHVFG